MKAVYLITDEAAVLHQSLGDRESISVLTTAVAFVAEGRRLEP